MSDQRSNPGPLIAGTALIAVGALALAGQLFSGFSFWEVAWPFIIVAVGILFFVGMLSGGKSAAPLAIPGSIFTAIGLLLFLQNITGHWESWAYAWTVILMAVGLGIYLMGRYADNPGQRVSGMRLLRIGAVLFILFGGFFESIFNSFGISRFIFPIALIVLGLYILMRRSRPAALPPAPPAPEVLPPTPSLPVEEQ